MNQESLPESLTLSLEEIRDQFETWRHTRQKRGPIPDRLWEAAVGLSGNYTILQISKALGLNYTDLKHRVLAQDAPGAVKAEETAGFIEFNLPQPISVGQSVIKMEKSNGAKMEMYFTAETRLDFLQLSKSFWSHGS